MQRHGLATLGLRVAEENESISIMCPVNMSTIQPTNNPTGRVDLAAEQNKRRDILDHSSGGGSTTTVSTAVTESERTVDISPNGSVGDENTASETYAPDYIPGGGSVKSADAQKRTLEFKKQSISFDTLSIREHPYTLGDHPDVVLGPPVSMAWEYFDFDSLSIDDYELRRGPRRSKHEMRLPANMRNRMMLSAGASKEDIMAATKAARKVQRQRTTTYQRGECGILFTLDVLFQSAKRKIKRRSWRSTPATSD
mmetsp:Transcript_36037/g.78324  ORF Transcript_36037/g.78324 Transcript_36037/m.78324 type:complete len:254 (-) Transcript_36037:1670-2431(-)